MGKLAHLKEGTLALQARLEAKQPPMNVSAGTAQLGDRMEGALSRLLKESAGKNNAGITKELKHVVQLVRESHNTTHQSVLSLAKQQKFLQTEMVAVMGDLKSSRPSPKGDDHLVTRLEKIAADLGTLPRSMPSVTEVNIDPLTDLSLQILAKLETPVTTVTPGKRDFVFDVVRDSFTDLIQKVNVKEI
jgi:hypothetical protein